MCRIRPVSTPRVCSHNCKSSNGQPRITRVVSEGGRCRVHCSDAVAVSGEPHYGHCRRARGKSSARKQVCQFNADAPLAGLPGQVCCCVRGEARLCRWASMRFSTRASRSLASAVRVATAPVTCACVSGSHRTARVRCASARGSAACQAGLFVLTTALSQLGQDVDAPQGLCGRCHSSAA